MNIHYTTFMCHRKRIWLSSQEETVQEFVCDGMYVHVVFLYVLRNSSYNIMHTIGACNILDTTTYDTRVTVALIQQGASHYLQYMPQESKYNMQV